VLNGRDLAISGPLVFFRSPRTFSFVEAQSDGVGGVDGLGGASDVKVSPDGRHVYVAGNTDNAVAVFSRDPDSGALTFVEAEFNGVGGVGVSGLNGATAIAISSDGQNVYVAGRDDSAIAVFSRNPSTGQLSFVEAKVDGVAGVDGLAVVRRRRGQPDGGFVYAAGNGESKIALFSRNAATGALAFVETVATAHVPVNLLLSPDGRHLYSTAEGQSPNPPILGFQPNPATGQLTLVYTDPASSPRRHSSPLP
jgi:6-phosphogluconolactonase (cycloisomerase 2 family)